MRSGKEGHWMCPEGPYQTIIQRLCDVDPRLRHRDSKATRQGTPWPYLRRGRVIYLQSAHDESYHNVKEWSSTSAFLSDLKAGDAIDETGNNVLLLEGLSPAVIDGLGSAFSIHPSFFADHERVVVFNSDLNGCSDYPTLPHSRLWKHGADGLTMKYFEVMAFDRIPDDFRASCAETGRHIGAVRLKGRLLPVVIVRRKCSIWPTDHPRGGRTCIIICDPPVREMSTRPGSGEQIHVQPVRAFPFQGGYVDFLDQSIQQARLQGPPRSCMFDDMVFYLTTHSSLLPSGGDATRSAIFVQKIIASHYVTLHNFMSSMLSYQHWGLSRRDDMSHMNLHQVEQQWSDVQSWDRRLSEYCGDIGDIMLKLGIDSRASPMLNDRSWHDSAADFCFLEAQFHQLRDRVQQINAAITGLAGIAGNRQSQREQQVSLRETRRTKALTLIGLVFIPLAYTSALFSMNERFIPGAAEFWLYFATSVPLGIGVLLLYALLDAKPTMSFLSAIGLFKDTAAGDSFLRSADA